MRTTVANPVTRGGRRLVNVTDRAHRYRANANPPPGPRLCHYCGSRRNVEIEHVDGCEEHGEPDNLTWACRRCNTQKGIVFRNAGRGRLTRQFNPRHRQANPAKSVGQWLTAVMSLKGGGPMPLDAAIEMVRKTPHEARSRFAREIWATRRARGTDRQEVPF